MTKTTQKPLARVVTGTGFTDSSSSTLSRLHWLPIDARIKFKIATLTYEALHTGNLPYLASLLHRHNPCRALRSASANVLSAHDLTYHLAPAPFVLLLRLSYLMSAHVLLSQHSVNI